MSVEEYTMEFDNLMFKSELEEPDEHSIARYLGELNFDIASVLNLQTYLRGYLRGSNSKTPISPKNNPKSQGKNDGKQPQTVSSST